MNFEIINQLSESAIFRTPGVVDKYSLSDLSLLFYMYVLASYILMHKDSLFIQHYCSKTKAFNNFDFFRSSATDFYAMAFVLSGKCDTYRHTPEILRNQKIATNEFLTFLTNIISELKSSWYQSYFFNLESRLKITNSFVRDARRKILNWETCKEKEKIIEVLYSKIRSLAPSSEILDCLNRIKSSALYESILIENRFDYLLKTYWEKIIDKAHQNNEIDWIDADRTAADDELLASSTLQDIELMDITPNKQYLQWLVLRYIAGNFRLEDAPRITRVLAQFNHYKNRLQQKDINQYKGVADIEDAVEPFLEKPASNREEKKLIKSDAEKIYEDDSVLVVVPKTEEAACYYGKNTRWCTAADNDNMFDTYNKRGPLYILIDKKKNKKYQLHLQTQQFMDENDQVVKIDDLTYLYTDAIKAIAPFWKKESLKTPKSALAYCQIFRERWFEAEKIIASNAYTAIDYSKDVLGKPFPLGEEAISKESDASIKYSLLWGKSFPKGEDAIAMNPFNSLRYAIEILHGRFKKGEKTIANHENCIKQYIEEILKRRWPEAESTIAKNGHLSVWYAIGILKAPFPPGEPAIRVTDFSVSRDSYFRAFPEREQIMYTSTGRRRNWGWENSNTEYNRNNDV